MTCALAQHRRTQGISYEKQIPLLQTGQSLAEKAFRRSGVPCRGEIEIDRVSMLVERPVQIGPLPVNLHISLIDPPAR